MEQGDECDFEFSDDVGSWIASLSNLGFLVSCLASGVLMNAVGRKWTMFIQAVPFIAGWVILMLPVALDLGKSSDAAKWTFYAGRLIIGLAGGAYTVVPNIYIAECAEADIRGILGSLIALMITSGMLFMNGLGALIDWMILTGICIVFPALTLATVPFIPESPVYLLSRGKSDEAEASLKWLRGGGGDVDVGDEMKEITQMLDRQKEVKSVSYVDILTKKVYLQPLLITMGVMITQQINGNSAVIAYLTDIFLAADTGLSEGLQATLVTFIQVVGIVAMMFVVDRYGRRILLIGSAISSALSMFALGTYFYLLENECKAEGDKNCVDPDTVSSLGWLPLASTMVFIFAFSLGVGPLPWVINGEIYPEESKGKSAPIGSSTAWLMVFLITLLTDDIQKAINYSGLYFLFASLTVGSVFFVFLAVPETKGKTPEEMRRYFLGVDK